MDLQALEERYRRSPDDAEPDTVIFNSRRYVLNRDNDEPVLFDRASYRLRTISPVMFSFLQQFLNEPRSKQYALSQPEMSLETWQKLLDIGALQRISS